ncbi:MAG: hypothetical protein M0Z30_21565 [Actinomycetota bacterium]|nr:hypothetical protein [Actinomycetota bacterium]
MSCHGTDPDGIIPTVGSTIQAEPGVGCGRHSRRSGERGVLEHGNASFAPDVGFVALAVGGLLYGPFLPLGRAVIQRHSPGGKLTALGAARAMLTVPASPGTALGGPNAAAIDPSAVLLSGLATIAAGDEVAGRSI